MADVVDQTNLKRSIEKKIWEKYNADAHKEGNWAKKFKNNAGDYLKDAQGNDVVVKLNMTVLRDLIADIMYDVLRGVIVSSGSLTADAEQNYETGDLVSGKGDCKDKVAAEGSLVLVSGTKGAAREDDSTLADDTTDPPFFGLGGWVDTVSGILGIAPLTSLTGKIGSGSSKVKIG